MKSGAQTLDHFQCLPLSINNTQKSLQLSEQPMRTRLSRKPQSLSSLRSSRARLATCSTSQEPAVILKVAQLLTPQLRVPILIFKSSKSLKKWNLPPLRPRWQKIITTTIMSGLRRSSSSTRTAGTPPFTGMAWPMSEQKRMQRSKLHYQTEERFDLNHINQSAELNACRSGS